MNLEYIKSVSERVDEKFVQGFPKNRFAKQSHEWWPSDTKFDFEDNVKKYPKSPHLLKYLENPISYKLNNFGMRTNDDFNLSSYGNVFLGCSHTFGVGHHLKDVWSYKVSKEIGDKFYNISEPSSGIMTQFRYLNYFKDKIKFKNVFHFFPEECVARWEYYNPNEDRYNVWDTENEKYKQFSFDILFEEAQQDINVLTHINAIENICKEVGANYFLITKTFRTDSVDPFHKTMIPARDLMHYYVEEHNQLAQDFLKMYNQKIQQ